MSDKFKIIALRALTDKVNKRLNINESRMTYEDGHSERLNTVLAKQLRDRKTSLGVHPIFPESDEMHFEEKLMSKRFSDVLKNFKRHHNTEMADISIFYSEQHKLLKDIINIEKSNKNELEEIAIRLIRDEFDMEEADVEIIAKLTTEFSDFNESDSRQEPDKDIEVTFDNHNELQQANKEVYKRRFVNALIQGSAKKVNHMFHMVDDELQNMNPLLPNSYSKLMTGADYAYMIEANEGKRMMGGRVQVEFPTVEGNRPKIIASALTFPVLIHEIMKGVMEILSRHGLPKDTNIAKYTLAKADYMNAEIWDMRLGPPIWEKFIESLPPEDFNLKHHAYIELVSLPVDEFNHTMREILLGSREGKAKIQSIIDDVKDDLRNDDFDNAMEHITGEDYLGPEDLDNLDDEEWF
jgi:hypothetical protein